MKKYVYFLKSKCLYSILLIIASVPIISQTYTLNNGARNGKINNNVVQHGLYSYSILANDFKNKSFIYTGIVTLIK